MSTNEPHTAPAVNSAPATDRPAAPPSRLLATGQAACLGLAVLTLVAGLIVVTGFLVSAPALRTPSPAPEDAAKMYTYTITETQRQQAAVEQRTAALQSFGLMVGAALAFVGLGLLLGAAGAEEASQDRLARAVPGTVALVCSAAVIIFAVPGDTQAGGQNPTVPYAVPPSFAVAGPVG